MRYVIIEESRSGHCCFKYTIIDLRRDDGESKLAMCECFDQKEAEAIAAALNRVHEIDRLVRFAYMQGVADQQNDIASFEKFKLIFNI